ncbi:MAG: ABC transporter permease, partial [Gemmatimonadales bacterium]|nr:ABC transporter permease [Gemmatimonadales bacterium]
TMLEGEPLGAVLPDVAALCIFAALLLALSFFLLEWSLRYAKRSGTLAHY